MIRRHTQWASRNRYRGKGRAKLWTADFIDSLQLPLGAVTFNQLVLPVDYRRSATMEPGGATLLRIRGSVGFTPGTVAAIATRVFAAAFVVDDDIAPVAGGALDPSIAQEVIDESVLWWRLIQIGSTALQDFSYNEQFDIKAKRKLVDKQVIFCFRPFGAAIQFTYNARALLSLE